MSAAWWINQELMTAAAAADDDDKFRLAALNGGVTSVDESNYTR